MKVKLFFSIFVLTLLLGAAVWAQDQPGAAPTLEMLNAAMEPDPGIPDTVKVISQTLPSGTMSFALQVNLYNDEELGGFNLPIKWDAPSTRIICDSVSFLGSRISYVNTKLYSIDTTNQRLQSGMIIFFESYLQAGSGLIYTVYFHVVPASPDQAIRFDSTFYPPGGNFALTLSNGANIAPQFKYGTVTIGTPKPTIALSPTSFTFNATQGGTNPATQVLNITNTGAGTLNWSATKKSSWLSLSPTSGTGNGATTLTVTLGSLTAGTYYDTIVVTDPLATNTPQKAPVTFIVAPPPPTIAVNPTRFDVTGIQGGTIPSQALSISNIGGSTLNWTVSKKTPWLGLSPTSGTNSGTVTLTFTLGSLPPGTYRDTVTVTAAGATNTPQKVPVVMTIQAPPPTIVLNPTSIAQSAQQGSTLPPQQVSITNSGGGTLNWTAAKKSGWLAISPTSGSGNGTITASFDLTGLVPGIYYDTITVTDPAATNSPQKTSVTLTITQQPQITLNPTSMAVSVVEGGSYPAQQVTLTNTGGGTLDWTAANKLGWITVSPTSGVGNATLNVSFNFTGITPGLYVDTITVTDLNASNSPQYVRIDVTVTQKPMIVLNPTSIEVTAQQGSAISPRQVSVTNGGGGTLNWTAAKKTGWLSLSPTSGTGNGTITASFNIAGVMPGTYYDTITVADANASNSPQITAVMLTVTPTPPAIDLEPASIVLSATEGGSIAPRQFSITNTGGGTLNWTASNKTGWIMLAPTSGAGDGIVTLSFDITGVTPGIYYDTITVSDPAATNSPQVTSVTLTVTPKPLIVLDPTVITVGAQQGQTITPRQIAVTNGGGGTLNWTASKLTGWTMLSPTSGTGNGTITVSFDITGVAPGIYYDTVTVSDPSAGNNPQKTAITLTVTPAPAVIVLNPTSIVLSAQEEAAIAPRQISITNGGGGTLNWTAVNKTGWIMVSPTSGTGNGIITLTFDITGVAPGVYVDTITVADPAATNSPQKTVVTLTITARPVIALNPTSIVLTIQQGGSITPRQIAITNTGGGTLHWTAANKTGWIMVSPTSGTGNGTLTLTFSVGSVGPGTYYDTITVSDPDASNSPAMTMVMLTINPPPTVVQVQTIAGETPDDIQIPITNTGGTAWTATHMSAWLTVTPSSGVGDAVITLSFDVTGLTPGIYADTVVVTTGLALKYTQYIQVQLTILPPPPDADTVYVETVPAIPGEKVVVDIDLANFVTIRSFSLPLRFDNTWVVCDSVSFAGTRMFPADESTVAVDNAAGTIYVYGFAMYGPILSPGSGPIAKAYFTVDPAAEASLAVIDTAAIEPSWFYEFLDGDGLPRSTEFFAGGVNISTSPCFDFPTDTVQFVADEGDIIPSISFPVNNNCGGTLTWSASEDADWLILTPTSGTQHDQITFAVDTEGLAPGYHITWVTFESNGSGTPATVVVTFNWGEAPRLALSTNLINLGTVCTGDTVYGSFDITNIGVGTLDWTAEAPPEIDLSAASGTAPSTVEFSIAVSSLPLGFHSLPITITADGALSSPQTVMVKMVVSACEECSFKIAEVVGPQGLAVGVPIYAYNIKNVAGLEFHIGYDSTILLPDSVTSTYMSNPTIGFIDEQIHYVWDDINRPINILEGDVIMTLWFTVVGQIGEMNCLTWLEGNELSDGFSHPIEGLVYCTGCVTVGEPVVGLSGRIVYYDLVKPVPDVTVALTGDASAADLTDQDGKFAFNDLPGGMYTVTPSRLNNDLGASVSDAIKIRRHLAHIEEFNSPFKMIAADVNLSQTVTVSDVIALRLYMAEIAPLPSGNWTFVDSTFAITMDNWWLAPRMMETELNANKVLPAFIGIRMGDVNNTWPLPKSPKMASSAVELTIPDLAGSPSEGVKVPILVTNFNAVAGVEIHIEYNAAMLTVDSITSGHLVSMTVNAVSGRTHVIWEDFEHPMTLTDGDSLTVIFFRVAPTASGDVTLTFMPTCELADTVGDPFVLSLHSGKLIIEPLDVDDDPTALPTAFDLKQNFPNPFNPSTTIAYSVDRTMDLVFEVYNVTGQVVDRLDLGRKAPGVYTLTYSGADLPSGVYAYRLIGDGISLARRMVLVK